MRGAVRKVISAAAVVCVAASAHGQIALDRADYQDRLRAFWLGQCIANWTGRITEGHRIQPPFFTAGSCGRWGVRKDQWGWYSAPAAIQRLRVSFWAGVSFLCDFGGGIT